MNKNTTRLTAITGATMALVIAGTAAVSAAGPRDRDEAGFGKAGFGKAGIGAKQGGEMMRGARGMGGMRGLDADFERSERTVQTADGITVTRIEQGVADAAAEDSLSFSLGSGEAVTVAVDEDTRVVSFEEQEVTNRRGVSRTRMAPSEVELGTIVAGAEVVVWSDSEDDGEFVASRIVLQPEETEEAEAEMTEDAEETEAVAETTEESEAVATDA